VFIFTAVVKPRLVNALTLPLQRGGPLVASVVSPPGGWKMAHLWMICDDLPIKNGDFP